MSRAANSLKTSDVITTPIKLKYTSSYSYETLGINGIEVWTGSNGPVTITGSVSQDTLNYRSIRHLFYSNFLTGSYLVSASLADNSLQSTAASGTLDADRRYFPTESGAKITVLSIPRKIYGEQISRRGFRVSSTGYNLVDDGNGNVVDTLSGSLQVGNIIYSQGLVIITNQDYLNVLDSAPAGLVYLVNNSLNITITAAYISDGLGSNYNLTSSQGSTLPLTPGQSGSFTVAGSSANNLVLSYSANSGSGTVTGSCNSSVQYSTLTSTSGSITINFSCSVPISPYSSYYGTVNQAPSYSIGQNVEGGIVGYTLRPGDLGYDPNMQHGIVVASASFSAAWTNGSTSFILGASSTDIGTGLTATNAIVATLGSGSYAAYIAKTYTTGGYTDWFLPSRDDLKRLYVNAYYIPGFTSSLDTPQRWSSTDYGSGFAWSSPTGSGFFITSKTTVLQFRPVRYY